MSKKIISFLGISIIAVVAIVQLNKPLDSSEVVLPNTVLKTVEAPENNLVIESNKSVEQVKVLPNYQLKLVGILGSNENMQALISIADAKAKIFSVNSIVTDKVLLEKVWRDHVTLMANNQRWQLYINQASGVEQPILKSTNKPKRKRTPKSIVRSSTGKYIVGQNQTEEVMKKFGLQKNDIILTVNGRDARQRSVRKLNRFIARPLNNRTLKLTVERGGKVIDVLVSKPE